MIRRPMKVGSPIDMKRMRSWTGAFTGYRITITESRIDRWLNNFANADKDLAARILDSVDFMSTETISDAFRALLGQMSGWNKSATKRTGKWRFVAFSGSAGESGDEMLRRLRTATGLSASTYSELFIHRSELLQQDLGPEDTVVFVDDLAGSGTQAIDVWPLFDELLPGRPNVYLLLVAATRTAVREIEKQTGLAVVAQHILDERNNVFSDACKSFTDEDKDCLLRYCTKADKNQPKGFADSGLVLVFAHGCPNNSIPILHSSSTKLEGLFRRYD